MAANSIWKVEAASFWVLPGIFLPLFKRQAVRQDGFLVCFLECLLPLAQSTKTAAGESFGLKNRKKQSHLQEVSDVTRGFETLFDNLTFVTAWKSCPYSRFKPVLISKICRRFRRFLWCWYVPKICQEHHGFPVGVFFPPLKCRVNSCHQLRYIKPAEMGEILHLNCFAGFLVLSRGSKPNNESDDFTIQSQQCWLCLFVFPVRPQPVSATSQTGYRWTHRRAWGWPSRLAKTEQNCRNRWRQRHLSKGDLNIELAPCYMIPFGLATKEVNHLPFCEDHLGPMFCSRLMLMVWVFFSWILGLVTVFWKFDFGSVS